MQASTLAALLIEHTREPAAAAALLDTAGTVRPLSIAATLDGPAALKFKSKAWQKAAAAAEATDDPAALATFAGDTRAAVRFAVARNASCSPETTAKLLCSAVAAHDTDLLGALLERVPLLDVLAAIAADPEYPPTGLNVPVLRQQVESSADRAVHELVCRVKDPTLLHQTVKAVREGVVDMTFTELLELTHADMHADLLLWFTSSPTITAAHAEVILAHAELLDRGETLQDV